MIKIALKKRLTYIFYAFPLYKLIKSKSTYKVPLIIPELSSETNSPSVLKIELLYQKNAKYFRLIFGLKRSKVFFLE